MSIKKVLALILFTLFIMMMAVFGILSYRIQHDERQRIFLQGSVPEIYPNGLYIGSTTFSQGVWKGKKFDSYNKSGINELQLGDSLSEGFPFKMYQGNGEVDTGLRTLKIDYNVPENFILMRLLVDEVVLTEPGKYLGKMELRIWPGKVIPLAYFRLDQPIQGDADNVENEKIPQYSPPAGTTDP